MGESLAIVFVILVMAAMYKRAGKGQLALLALPLICVPCARLLCFALLGAGGGVSSLYGYMIVTAGLVASVCLCTLLSRKLANRTIRLSYLALSFIFSGALVVAYLI